METIIKPIVEITIAGKNVTADVSPYLSKITFTDKLEAESDDITVVFDDVANLWASPWYPQKGDTLTVKMGYAGNMLDCGLFEIDEIEYDTPPDTFTIKAIAAAITKGLRTRNSKAFEKQTLKSIAQYFADKHGLSIVGSTTELQNIEIERKTQENQTDLSFLAALSKEFGFVFSVRGSKMVFIDITELEKRPSVMTFQREKMSKCNFRDKTAQTYGNAVVSKRNARTNEVTKWSIKAADNENEADTLVVSGNAENDAQAQAKAKGELKEKNKDKTTGNFSIEGTTGLVAGINIDIEGMGNFSGKWHVVQTDHTIDTQTGYTTTVAMRKAAPQN